VDDGRGMRDRLSFRGFWNPFHTDTGASEVFAAREALDDWVGGQVALTPRDYWAMAIALQGRIPPASLGWHSITDGDQVTSIRRGSMQFAWDERKHMWQLQDGEVEIPVRTHSRFFGEKNLWSDNESRDAPVQETLQGGDHAAAGEAPTSWDDIRQLAHHLRNAETVMDERLAFLKQGMTAQLGHREVLYSEGDWTVFRLKSDAHTEEHEPLVLMRWNGHAWQYEADDTPDGLDAWDPSHEVPKEALMSFLPATVDDDTIVHQGIWEKLWHHDPTRLAVRDPTGADRWIVWGDAGSDDGGDAGMWYSNPLLAASAGALAAIGAGAVAHANWRPRRGTDEAAPIAPPSLDDVPASHGHRPMSLHDDGRGEHVDDHRRYDDVRGDLAVATDATAADQHHDRTR